MLKIFNDLRDFIEDSTREINVREYARLMNISPPTASKILSEYENQKILQKREDKGYLLFKGDIYSWIFIDLSRLYYKFKTIDMIEYINEKLNFPLVILFGSLSKGENNAKSDIDLCIITKSKEKLIFH
ncbi:nucleotidyltransferase domain-containing protein [Nanoarchaeota archaeon]